MTVPFVVKSQTSFQFWSFFHSKWTTNLMKEIGNMQVTTRFNIWNIIKSLAEVITDKASYRRWCHVCHWPNFETHVFCQFILVSIPIVFVYDVVFPPVSWCIFWATSRVQHASATKTVASNNVLRHKTAQWHFRNQNIFLNNAVCVWERAAPAVHASYWIVRVSVPKDDCCFVVLFL